MNVVVAIDSFKGSLSSLEAGQAVKDAVLACVPSPNVTVCPMADGGEGTVEALSQGRKVKHVKVTVKGPRLTPVEATYSIIEESQTAVIEMAAASGITLVPPHLRNPLETTTYGVGEMMIDALERGCRKLIIGIGGSATNDGGVGMLTALGYAFLDKEGHPIPLGGKGLEHLCSISAEGVHPALFDATILVACDVENPLCGENGCSAIYGPQKGATPDTIKKMDAWLECYANIARTISPTANKDYPGAGAAGGLGFAFLAFTPAVLDKGVDIVLQESHIEDVIKTADIVVTGEGRLDGQSVMGKAPIGVAKLAKKHGKKVIAFCGCVGDGAEACHAHGIDAFFPILRRVTTLEEALDIPTAYANLKDTAYEVFRLWQMG
ncbi:MAG: glycerate kinase [Clostridia bacterium]|nr:glycerate kinase [Clostridia bacterium]